MIVGGHNLIKRAHQFISVREGVSSSGYGDRALLIGHREITEAVLQDHLFHYAAKWHKFR